METWGSRMNFFAGKRKKRLREQRKQNKPPKPWGWLIAAVVIVVLIFAVRYHLI